MPSPDIERSSGFSRRRSFDFDVVDLLLRADERAHHVVAEPQRRRLHKRLMHALAELRRHAETFGHMRVVTKILLGEPQQKWQTRIVALQNSRNDHLEDAAVGTTGGDDLLEGTEIEPGALARHQSLSNQGRLPHRQKIIDELRGVTGARAADVEYIFRERIERRLDPREDLRFGTDHHIKLACFSFARRSCEWSIDKRHRKRLQVFINAGGRGRLTGRAIDNNLAGFHRTLQTVRAVDHLFNLRRTGNA